ncbi:hypothetical protein LS72_007745 [Helicobacter apodemus]|uniref:Uncharacterized protein n=1 Tax=Helicobacter apodemus TaxID=135569 RepID=A0A4V6I6H0_9HELI|nr:hypothetical protein [Helicobacter apodemus]TLE14916.1 hypothetical protein LS72_007745 [Helicobacter apodemus]
MLKLQNISFENRVVVGVNAIYVILPFFFYSFGNSSRWEWGIFAFWCSLPLINALLYWIISGYKKQKGTKFGFWFKLIIALWPVITFFSLIALAAIFG